MTAMSKDMHGMLDWNYIVLEVLHVLCACECFLYADTHIGLPIAQHQVGSWGSGVRRTRDQADDEHRY